MSLVQEEEFEFAKRDKAARVIQEAWKRFLVSFLFVCSFIAK